jgi:chemotaxis protein MotB
MIRGGVDEVDNSERWLLTYADMITLLLVLFIVLFALSTINEAKYEQFKQSVTEAVLSDVPHGTTDVHDKPAPDVMTTSGFQQLQRELSLALKAKGLLGDVTFDLNSSGLVEGLVSDSTFFETASADLSSVGAQIVDASAQVLKRFSNAIEVAGYTDDRPISGTYANNWALSAARASTVVVRMTEVNGVDPNRVILVGYGQYHPLVPNTTLAGQAQNRRINIVIKPTSKVGQ